MKVDDADDDKAGSLSLPVVHPFPVWDEEIAREIVGKYCMVQASYSDEAQRLLETEQFHGVIVATDRVRGVWFRLKGSRDGEDWVGPPDLSVFQLPPGGGEFTLSETGEIVTDPDYIIFYSFLDPRSPDLQ